MIYSNVQLVLGAVYLLIMLLSSLVCGYSFSLTRIDKDRRGLFAIGVSLTPCVVGTWMMLFSVFPDVGHKQILCILFYLICLFVSIILMQKNMKCDFDQFLNNKRKVDITFVCWLICIVVFFVWCSLSICGFQVNFDASFYMAEALKYVNTMSFHDIATHRDYVDNTLPGSPHNFLWPGYLSFGLLFTENGDYGLMHDISVYFAFILAGIYLIVALWGTILIFVKNLKIACVTSLFLFITPFFLLLASSSRDIFRSIPLIVLLALLYINLNNEYKEKRTEIIYCIFVSFTCYFLVGGHPINAFTGVLIVLIWAVLSLFTIKNVKEIIKVCIAMLIGVFIGSYNFVYALVDTGTLSGNCSLYGENIYWGSPILEVYINFMKSTMVTNNNYYYQVHKIFSGDTYKICFVAAVTSILIFFRYIKGKNILIMPILVYALSFFLIFIGTFFSWGEFSYAEWLSRNKRYMYQFYVIAIICLAIFIFELSKFLYEFNFSKKIFTKSNLIAIVVLYSLTLMMFRSFNVLRVRDSFIAYYNKTGKVVYDLYNSLPATENILIAENRWSYVTNVHAKVLASHFGEPLFRVKEKEEVWNFLQNNKIRYVFLNSEYLRIFWKNAAFYQAILELRDMGKISEISTNVFRINGSL